MSAKRAGKLKDKWKEKSWVVVEAPAAFGSTTVAYVPLTETNNAIGRVVETTLYDLVKQDPQQYAIKLYFQIQKIEADRAKTIFKGHEYAREYLRSLVRRGSSMVNSIDDFTTKDGVEVRVYFVAFVQGRINSSRKHALRAVASKILSEKIASLTYDQFAQEVVLGKIASDIYNEAKKITRLRHVGIRKSKMIRMLQRPMEIAPVAAAVSQPTGGESIPS